MSDKFLVCLISSVYGKATSNRHHPDNISWAKRSQTSIHHSYLIIFTSAEGGPLDTLPSFCYSLSNDMKGQVSIPMRKND